MMENPDFNDQKNSQEIISQPQDLHPESVIRRSRNIITNLWNARRTTYEGTLIYQGAIPSIGLLIAYSGTENNITPCLIGTTIALFPSVSEFFVEE